MFWKLRFTVQSNFKNRFKYTNEAAIGKSLEIANSNNYKTYEAAGYYLPQKRAPFFAFSIKLVLICNKFYQCKLVCTGAMNECCKKLTM